jgi:ribosomal protein S18 acetylase RimI-like enzyme
LKAESKRALVAYDHGQIAGVTIYQRHKEHANAIELKNITVRPDVRGRYVASFLLRNTEIEGLREFQGIDSLLADSKVKNQEIKKFLISNKYRVIDRQDIYQLDTGDDYIYRKTLTA